VTPAAVLPTSATRYVPWRVVMDELTCWGARMRWIVVVRAVALLVGVVAIVSAALWSVGPYRDATAFRHAYLCPGGSPTPASATRGCVAREIGSVTGRHTYETSDSDGDGSTSEETHYTVSYQRASGMTESQEVVGSVYDAARPGARADLETWRGAVVWITVAGRSDGFDPPTVDILTYTAQLGWAGLGLVLWFLVGDGTLAHLFGNGGLRPLGWIMFGFWTVLAVQHALTDELSTSDYVWGPVLWIFGLALTAFCVFGNYGEYQGEESVLRVLLERRARGRRARKVAA
jgi:hypothetical protein